MVWLRNIKAKLWDSLDPSFSTIPSCWQVFYAGNGRMGKETVLHGVCPLLIQSHSRSTTQQLVLTSCYPKQCHLPTMCAKESETHTLVGQIAATNETLVLSMQTCLTHTSNQQAKSILGKVDLFNNNKNQQKYLRPGKEPEDRCTDLESTENTSHPRKVQLSTVSVLAQWTY